MAEPRTTKTAILRLRVTPATWQLFYDAYAEWRKGRTTFDPEEFLVGLLKPAVIPPGPRRSVMSAIGGGRPPASGP